MIYKYLDEKTLQPVQDRTLKFATIDDLNDPFENLPRATPEEEPIEDQVKRFKEYGPAMELLEGIPAEETDRLITNAFEASKSKFDGSQHHTPTLHNQIEMQKSVSETIGILALTSSPTNSLMWSHYANKHQGYVLGFDDSHPLFQGVPEKAKHLGRLLPVDYSNLRIELGEKMSEDQAFSTFFRKSLDWRYEDEFRILLPLKICTEVCPGIHVIKYPVEALKEVIFGFNCDSKTVDTIRESLDGQNVTYFRAIPSSISYDMVVESEESYHADLAGYTDQAFDEFRAAIELKAGTKKEQ